VNSEGFATYSSDGTVRFWDCSGFKLASTECQAPQLSNILYVDQKGLDKTTQVPVDPKPSRTGVRSLAIAPTQKIVACGDRQGNIQ
jgi:WD40 repeat protein